MQTVGAYEAKTHLPKLIRRVQKGERVTITKHGVPIAVIQPADADTPKRHVETKAVIEELRRFREDKTLGGMSIRELIEEGRH
ncbi:MAG: type II toxin-antitoxin system prevent-host-death family antitoxin [Candidatus Omnitrophota bacterium]